MARSGEATIWLKEKDLLTPAALDEAKSLGLEVLRTADPIPSPVAKRTTSAGPLPPLSSMRAADEKKPIKPPFLTERKPTAPAETSTAAKPISTSVASVKPSHSSGIRILPRVAVLGAGHGGLATAAHLTLKGFPTTLFSFFESELTPVREREGVQLIGDVQGFARIDRVTTSIDVAVSDADMILVVYPALVHSALASIVAASLKDDQLVLLTPGRTGGALEFARTLKRFAAKRRIYLSEAQSFMYAAESRGPAKVCVVREKHTMRVSALPASDNEIVVPRLQRLYPQMEPAQNVLETSLNNIGAVVHPAPMILNLPAIERAAAGEKVRHYRELITESICELYLEPIDAEKVAIARAMGLEAWTARDWYRNSYNVQGESLYDVLQRNPYYAEFAAPTHFLGYHHILDEIPNSLVPIACLGTMTGVPTPTIDAIIDMASAACRFDFRKEGRTIETLGLAGLTLSEVMQYVDYGTLPGKYADNGIIRRDLPGGLGTGLTYLAQLDGPRT